MNCVFLSNSAGGGGAVSGESRIYNCTFYGNRAKDSGGAFLGGGWVYNSIFYKNTAGEKENDIATDGNMEIDFSLVNYLTGAAHFGAHNIMGDPRFVDPDNGNLRLRPDSPAIDKGKSALARSKHDRDGKPRVVGKRSIWALTNGGENK